jgi:hypothetical protein
MKCALCGNASKVLETRKYNDPNRGFDYTERRLRCLNCDHRFNTIEVLVEVWIDVQK